MCPQVNSAEEAEAWASALHYGPSGSRGVALFHRGARFGTDPDAIEHSRARVLGIAQIESPEAVEAVEEIAAVPGIDVLFVGPSDLSYSMGRFREFDHPVFRAGDRARRERGPRRARPPASSSPRPTRSRRRWPTASG